MKTELDIKTDLFLYLKESPLVQNISGKLSKIKRLDSSDKEDVIISVLTTNPNAQVQELYLNVNIYVSDLLRGTQYEENGIRLNELCKLAHESLDCVRTKGGRFTLTEQKIYEVPGRNEHFINNRVLYQFCNA